MREGGSNFGLDRLADVESSACLAAARLLHGAVGAAPIQNHSASSRSPPLSAAAAAARRLALKGAPGEEAVLCSACKTYAVKNVETTNLVLLVQEEEAAAAAAPTAGPLASQDPNVPATPPGALVGLATQLQKVRWLWGCIACLLCKQGSWKLHRLRTRQPDTWPSRPAFRPAHRRTRRRRSAAPWWRLRS